MNKEDRFVRRSCRARVQKSEILFLVISFTLLLSSMTGTYLVAPSLSNLDDSVLLHANIFDVAASSILITSDGDFSKVGSTWTGSGTQEDPFYLGDLMINLTGISGNCIEIRNTRSFFKIERCTLIGGTSGYGILLSNVTNGGIENNTLLTNTEGGIYAAWSNFCNFSNNNIQSNYIGVELHYSSSNDSIWKNTISSSTWIGAYFGSTSGNNTIYWNTFLDNEYNLEDNSISWQNNISSNYWSDYSGDDDNLDGVGDTPYNIAGNANNLDSKPMMIPPTLDPIVWIEEPKDQIAQYGYELRYDLNVTAYAGVDYWSINDTASFNIDNDGIITNNSFFSEGWSTGLNVEVYDIYGNSLSAEFSITVLDTTPPKWEDTPENSVIEFGDSFSFDVNASDPSGVDTWWLNDTIFYSIDKTTGQLENNTLVPVGKHSLQILVNDTYNQIATYDFSILVEDTIPPSLVEEVETQVVEFGDFFIYDINATDLASIDSWWVNDSSNFNIDSNGIITNASYLSVDLYPLSIFVNDTHGVTQTINLNVLVEDTTSPTWSTAPANAIAECGVPFSQQLYATDLSGVAYWRINDTEHFLITSTGLLMNLGVLLPGTYSISVVVYDMYSNPCDASAQITIQDTRDPVWNSIPAHQIVEFGSDLHYELDAYDPTGIETWYVSDTAHFSIDENGTLSNIFQLTIGSYGVLIRATDSYGNSLESAMTISVVDTTPPVWIEMPEDQVLHFGEHLVYQMNASDLAGIDHWEINDIENFSISDTGLLTSSVLDVGQHNLLITVFDSSGNSVSTSISILVISSQRDNTSIIIFGGLGVVAIVILGGVFILRKMHHKSAFESLASDDPQEVVPVREANSNIDGD